MNIEYGSVQDIYEMKYFELRPEHIAKVRSIQFRPIDAFLTLIRYLDFDNEDDDRVQAICGVIPIADYDKNLEEYKSEFPKDTIQRFHVGCDEDIECFMAMQIMLAGFYDTGLYTRLGGRGWEPAKEADDLCVDTLREYVHGMIRFEKDITQILKSLGLK